MAPVEDVCPEEDPLLEALELDEGDGDCAEVNVAETAVLCMDEMDVDEDVEVGENVSPAALESGES